MGRRGHSTTIGKFAKIHHDRRMSEIRIFGELLKREQQERASLPDGLDPIEENSERSTRAHVH